MQTRVLNFLYKKLTLNHVSVFGICEAIVFSRKSQISKLCISNLKEAEFLKTCCLSVILYATKNKHGTHALLFALQVILNFLHNCIVSSALIGHADFLSFAYFRIKALRTLVMLL